MDLKLTFAACVFSAGAVIGSALAFAFQSRFNIPTPEFFIEGLFLPIQILIEGRNFIYAGLGTAAVISTLVATPYI